MAASGHNRLVVPAIITALGLYLGSGSSFAAGFKNPHSTGRAGRSAGANSIPGSMQRHWKLIPPPRELPRQPHPGYYRYPRFYFHSHDPRSVIIITPSYDAYPGRVSVLTAPPYYCRVHHVGFVSRVGFLDHVGGIHKIPLTTIDSICTEFDDVCVLEGY